MEEMITNLSVSYTNWVRKIISNLSNEMINTYDFSWTVFLFSRLGV